MKKVIVYAIALIAVFSVMPARALNRGIVYGFVLSTAGPFGPVKVQTYSFGTVTVAVPPNATTSTLYLGADVCCQVDYDGNLYIADLPNDTRNFVDKRSWLGQVMVWEPDAYDYKVTSPAGLVQILVDSELVRALPVRIGSLVKITAIKSQWADRFTAVDMKVVSW